VTPLGTLNTVIAITGASSGIGRAIAERAAAQGAMVVLSARRADLLNDIVAGIGARGGRAMAVPGDVTSETDMQRLVASAVNTFGRLDVMICNAGIGYHDRFEATPPDVMRRLLDVNVMGTFHAAHAALAQFRQQQSGHIIATSSIVGRRGIPGSSGYAATKFAQVGLIEALRAETYGTSIHASLVYPISTDTEFRQAITRDFGREAHGTGPKQSAAHVADAIIACIRRPRPEVYPYPRAWWLAVVSVIAPALADRLVQKYTRQSVQKADA
jgi:NADP-dependent 3-hydroxy acid dehydrogenase YdfG